MRLSSGRAIGSGIGQLVGLQTPSALLGQLDGLSQLTASGSAVHWRPPINKSFKEKLQAEIDDWLKPVRDK